MGNYDLVLVDGHSLVYRAFFALPPLSMPDGQQTNAVYGFARMLFRLINEQTPRGLIVAFDVGIPEFRLKIYPEYKAHRPDMPDDLRSQFPLVRQLLSVLGITVAEKEGYEADDIVGTLSHQAEDSGYKTLIVTGDRDVLQLITDNTHVCLTRKGISDTEIYDVSAVKQRFGVEPVQLLDVKALMGDSSDNIPGVRGIGEKTALKLVHEYGSLDEMLACSDQIPRRPGKLLRENTDAAVMSRQLATIDIDAPVKLDFDEAAIKPGDRGQIEHTLVSMGFRSLLGQIPMMQQPAQTDLFSSASEVVVEAAADNIDAIRNAAQHSGKLAIFLADVDGVGKVIGFSTGEDKCWQSYGNSEHIVHVVSSIIPHWCNGEAEYEVFTYGGKELMSELTDAGYNPDAPCFDVELAWYLIDPSRTSYPVSDLAISYLGVNLPELVTRKRRGQNPDASTAAMAAGQSSGVLARLAQQLTQEMKQRGLYELFTDVELPLMRVLCDMERRGISVDREQLRKLGTEFSQRMTEISEQICEHTDTECNLNSPHQVATLLFEQLKLPVVKKTKTGYSTDAEVLAELAVHHPVPGLILEHRQLAKLRSTYVDALSEVITDNGRIHTRFNQTVTATGRLSSSDPNLQNIPVRMDIGRKIRKVFVPDQGKVLMAADYSQIELRILAHLSGDDGLIQSFCHDEDIHTRTAAEVFAVEKDEVTRELRSKAKAVNFGIVYGITGYGLSRDTGVSQSESEEYIARYFQRYPGVKEFMDEQVEFARRHGYVKTMLGRRRYLPDINSRVVSQRKFAERTAFNTPVQGSAADIIKLAMLAVAERLARSEVNADLLLQVHDELVFEVEQDHVELAAGLVREQMEGVYALQVPLTVDIKIGDNWAEMRELEDG